VPARSLSRYITESVQKRTRWAVFEPNDERLWARVRRDTDGFMMELFRRGKLAGRTPGEAFSVHCGQDTTSADDIRNGAFNVQIGFADPRTAEFVVISIRQSAGGG
jgi:phage tail sheath protein FI